MYMFTLNFMRQKVLEGGRREREEEESGIMQFSEVHRKHSKVLAVHLYVHSFFLSFLSGSCESRKVVDP